MTSHSDAALSWELARWLQADGQTDELGVAGSRQGEEKQRERLQAIWGDCRAEVGAAPLAGGTGLSWDSACGRPPGSPRGSRAAAQPGAAELASERGSLTRRTERDEAWPEPPVNEGRVGTVGRLACPERRGRGTRQRWQTRNKACLPDILIFRFSGKMMRLLQAAITEGGNRRERNHSGFFQDQKNVFPKLDKVRLRNPTWALGAWRLLAARGRPARRRRPQTHGPPGEETGHLNFSRPKQ